MTAPDPGTSTAAPARTLLIGCGFLVFLLAAVVVLAVLLWNSLTEERHDPPSRPPASATPEDGALTRTRRAELTRELGQVEQDLGFAEGQARVSIDPATRQAWNDRARELRARRDELRAVLGR